MLPAVARLKNARSLCQLGLQRWVQTTAQSEIGVAAALRTQVRPAPGVFSRGFATGENASSAAGAAPKLMKTGITGPYATWGAVGAGAALMFYLFAGSSSNSISLPGNPSGGQQTREQAHQDRTDAGTHPKQICDFKMQTETGTDYTLDDLKGSFAIVMFGDSVTNHALQGLSKMEDITTEQDRMSNMQMNKPIWIVEDTELIKSPEGRRKLQDTANDHKRLLIIHGADFGKIKQSVQEYTKTIDGAKDELKNCDEGVYFLINPSGEFVKAFGHEKTSQEIGAVIAEECKYYKSRNPTWHHPKAIKKRVG